MTTNYKEIGVGMQGIVIRPAVPCLSNTTNFGDNTIGKIASYKTLKNEYDHFMKYIDAGSTISRYVTKDQIILCPFDIENYVKNVKIGTNIHTFGDDIEDPYQLVMPFFGNTLLNYLENFRNQCDKKSNDKNIITVAEFNHLTSILLNLWNETTSLNKQGLFHKDVKPNNIIYNVEEGVMFYIDYGGSVSGDIQTMPFGIELTDKKDFLETIYTKVLKIGFANKTIYDALYDTFVKLQLLLREIVHFSRGLEFYKQAYVDELLMKSDALVNEISVPISSTVDELNADTSYCNYAPPPRSIEEQRAIAKLASQKKQYNLLGRENRGGKKRTKRRRRTNKGRTNRRLRHRRTNKRRT